MYPKAEKGYLRRTEINTRQACPLETFPTLRFLVSWSNMRCQKVLEKFRSYENEKLTNRKIYIKREFFIIQKDFLQGCFKQKASLVHSKYKLLQNTKRLPQFLKHSYWEQQPDCLRSLVFYQKEVVQDLECWFFNTSGSGKMNSTFCVIIMNREVPVELSSTCHTFFNKNVTTTKIICVIGLPSQLIVLFI